MSCFVLHFRSALLALLHGTLHDLASQRGLALLFLVNKFGKEDLLRLASRLCMMNPPCSGIGAGLHMQSGDLTRA